MGDHLPGLAAEGRRFAPTPAPGEEYASEVGYVYDAMVVEDAVLRAGPQWVFAVDYDGEGRIQSLRETFRLTVE